MSGISVATIKSPEFINVTSINPTISKCEIKVLYVGQNRNMSFISKEVATEMAKTLPGTAIVGYYSEKEEDFRDHGEQVVIDGDGIKFNCLTKPYGFVAPDAKIWFQEFEDTDEFGNKTLREYLMCEGYLWTEQYKEAKKIIAEGRPQSMELDEKSLKGHWSTDSKSGLDFFIINDAIFSKLCILGEDVEPCFEGAAVTSPEVSSSFTLDNKEFRDTLFTMMKELKEFTSSLQNQGGKSMNDKFEVGVQTPESVAPTAPEATVENPGPVAEDAVAVENENLKAELDNSNQEIYSENQETVESSVSLEEPPVQEENIVPEAASEPVVAEENGAEQYSILEQKFNELTEKYALLEQQNNELLAFKTEVENKEKDALIASFYMLSDEDKKNVIENKANYSLDDIEKELSVICVRKKVSFESANEENNNEPTYTFNVHSVEADADLPAWLKAVESHKKNY
ncbi:MAG: hypothetical protein J6Z11_03525 [Candidatus Riflebacteria bacterium]|nr:hypothetical protein [Candidatus Riflebacteria bacterium]